MIVLIEQCIANCDVPIVCASRVIIVRCIESVLVEYSSVVVVFASC